MKADIRMDEVKFSSVLINAVRLDDPSKLPYDANPCLQFTEYLDSGEKRFWAVTDASVLACEGEGSFAEVSPEMLRDAVLMYPSLESLFLRSSYCTVNSVAHRFGEVFVPKAGIFDEDTCKGFSSLWARLKNFDTNGVLLIANMFAVFNHSGKGALHVIRCVERLFEGEIYFGAAGYLWHMSALGLHCEAFRDTSFYDAMVKGVTHGVCSGAVFQSDDVVSYFEYSLYPPGFTPLSFHMNDLSLRIIKRIALALLQKAAYLSRVYCMVLLGLQPELLLLNWDVFLDTSMLPDDMVGALDEHILFVSAPLVTGRIGAKNSRKLPCGRLYDGSPSKDEDSASVVRHFVCGLLDMKCLHTKGWFDGWCCDRLLYGGSTLAATEKWFREALCEDEAVLMPTVSHVS